MSAVFADTFYFLALFNRADAAHERAARFSRTHRSRYVTTVWVLTELADAWNKSPDRLLAVRFIRGLWRNEKFRIVPLSGTLFDRGLELYASRSDKEWSLTDCISFVAMRDEGLTDALTGDHHFEQAGFVALLN